MEELWCLLFEFERSLRHRSWADAVVHRLRDCTLVKAGRVEIAGWRRCKETVAVAAAES